MLDFNPTLAAVQFLPPTDWARLERAIQRASRRSPRFARRLEAAKQKAQADAAAYEEWLCQQHAVVEEDIPW